VSVERHSLTRIRARGLQHTVAPSGEYQQGAVSLLAFHFISFRECLNSLWSFAATKLHDQANEAETSIHRWIWTSGQDSTVWFIVCTSPHWHLSVGVMCQL